MVCNGIMRFSKTNYILRMFKEGFFSRFLKPVVWRRESYWPVVTHASVQNIFTILQLNTLILQHNI